MDRPVVDETSAWLLFEQLRWNGRPDSCPHCAASGRCYFLAPNAGERRTRSGRATARRVWKCGACRRQFSVLTGTVLEGTRIPLPVWVSAVDRFRRTGAVTGSPPASRAARRYLEQVLRAALDPPDSSSPALDQVEGRCQD